MTDPTTDAAKLLPCPLSDDQIRHMVDRFLGWRLPKPWTPDNGISYVRPNYMHPPADHDWPTGTNLFDWSQAEAMVRYMTTGLPAENTRPQPAPPEGEPDNLDEVLSRAGWALNDATWRFPKDCQSPGWVPECRAAMKLIAEYQRRYRLGLTARPKVEDAEVAAMANELRSPHSCLDQNAGCTNERFMGEAANLLERLAGELLTKETELLSMTRYRDMNNEALGEANTRVSSLYDRAEAAESALAEREAELAKADACVVASYEGCSDEHLNDAGFECGVRCSRERHAARQQQKVSAEKDKP